MTDAERFALLEQWYGDTQPGPQYNPATLIEQIRWWERKCDEQRWRILRAEKDRGWWICLALAELLVLLAVAGARLL